MIVPSTLGNYESGKFPLPTVSRFRNGTLQGLGQTGIFDQISSGLANTNMPLLIAGAALLALALGMAFKKRTSKRSRPAVARRTTTTYIGK